MTIQIKRDAMRRALVLTVTALSLAVAARPSHAAKKPPIVMELFTAEGCTGCPSAADVFDAYAERHGVIALTFPVDYWDYLGWRDTFAQPAFADRQRAYARRLKVREIYTPEMVLDGRREAPGLDHERVEALVDSEVDQSGKAPAIRFMHHGSKIEVGNADAPRHGGEVWLVRYDPTPHSVKVRTGENKGKTVQVRNVVQELTRLGAWSGGRRLYTVPKAEADGLKTVILVQDARGGPIVAAAKA